MSYADLCPAKFGLLDDGDFSAGDLVCGQNREPVYCVIAVDGSRAWVRRVDTGEDHLAYRARLRKC